MYLPAHEGRAVDDQPDLDLLVFEPYIPASVARRLFEFLRAELPFYRVEYDIKRGGIETHIRTPRSVPTAPAYTLRAEGLKEVCT